MGYTSYFYRKQELDAEKFASFAEDVRTLLSRADIPLTGVDDCDGPTINKDTIWFNGKDDDAHETMVIHQIYQGLHAGDEKPFAFCKTAHKPYDKYVVATLILAKLYFEKDFDISSDGDIPEWQEGLQIVNTIFDYDVKIIEGEDQAVENATITATNFFPHQVKNLDEFEREINNPTYK